MHTATCPRTVTLWTPPHRRVFDFLAQAGWRLHDAWQGYLERQRAHARAQAQAVALAELDDRMRRDLGLGERSGMSRRRDDTLLDWPRS